MSPEKSVSPFSFKFLSYSFFPFCVTSQFSCVFPEMVDKLVLLDSIPFFLDCNVRMGAFVRAATGPGQGPQPWLLWWIPGGWEEVARG